MIISKITGGLGNQLFQYAFGKRLSIEYGTSLKLDLSFYDEEFKGHRVDRMTSPGETFYYLPSFSVSASEVTHEEIFDVIRFGRYGKRFGEILESRTVGEALRRWDNKYRTLGRALNLYIERSDDYWRHNPAALKTGSNAYVSGYWECPQYFEDIRDVIEAEFELSAEIVEEGEEIAKKIRESESVGLHVRRGVRVGYGTTVPTEYYQRAIDEFANEDVTFFVFSVDPDWVRENLNFPSTPTFVDYTHPDGGGVTPRAYEYFELLRQCDHKIISNSTFSWWPAWLNEQDGARILCPHQWRPESSDYDRVYVEEMDLIPDSWEIIEWG